VRASRNLDNAAIAERLEAFSTLLDLEPATTALAPTGARRS